MSEIFDFAVIGAGIAGASVAARLAPEAKVVMLEMESQPGYHTTGRSAALFTETYGPGPIRALTRASAAFFHCPPTGFCENPILSERGVLMTASKHQLEALENLVNEVSADTKVQTLSSVETLGRMPLLRETYIEASMLDPSAKDIDVNALHQGFMRQFRHAGGLLVTNAAVHKLSRTNDVWELQAETQSFCAKTVINAAGAWADEIGKLAGATNIGLIPKRRTVLTVQQPEGKVLDDLPMVVDVDEEFYLKPDAGKLLISPADETPSPPCDAQPEELDIAICIDRIHTAFDLKIGRIESKWAGLRSFVADKCPVCGFDPLAPNFFWLAGQGGYGIQTAPALSEFAALLAKGEPLSAHLVKQGLTAEELAPDRPQLNH